MKEYLKAVKISEKVYWVGAIDWNVRNFHGYETNRGTTYNAFLILDEKITLIDTVKAPFFDELMARISSVIDPEKIDYIISNHSEMDHSGALVPVMNAVKPEKVFASVMGVRNLKAHFGADLPVIPVKTGDAISIGSQSLHFVETKMLHWPDSMVSYLDGEKILFTQDAFGMHLAGSKLYADEYQHDILEFEAKKYFANILLHLSGKIIELLDSLPNLKLDIQMIAPDHGPLWRTPKDIEYILNLYRQCAEQKPQPKALVFYATMWHSTEMIATAIADGIRDSGVWTEVIALNVSDRSQIITKILDSGLIAVGSPTMNNQMFPAMADIITYMRGLKPKNKIGYSFGSFGWSGEAPKIIQNELEALGFDLPLPPGATKYVPTSDDLQQYFQYGQQLAQTLLEKTK